MFVVNNPDSLADVNGKPDSSRAGTLLAGAAAFDITPRNSRFLWGYPHVERMSAGIHDPLLASAIHLWDGAEGVVFVSCDVLFVSKDLAARARSRIAALTGLAVSHIAISATHTHSGPKTANTLGQAADPVVPPADDAYLIQMEDGIVEAAVSAWRRRIPAEAGFAWGDGTGLGTNRHDPQGVSDLKIPVLMLRALEGGDPIALMVTACMHPTVLHEDSKLFSGDFPGLARQHLQRALGDIPVVYNSGAAGNQSPRHVTRGNTFEEAERLGEILSKAVLATLPEMDFKSCVPISCRSGMVDLPLRALPSVAQAEAELQAARTRWEKLRRDGGPHAEVRTAECDCFGAEKTVVLAKTVESGELEAALASILPAEIQVFSIGPRTYVTWPGEMFVEFGLAVSAARPETCVISLTNGYLGGYLVTREAVDRRFYEAGNALLASPAAGELLVGATRRLIEKIPQH